MQSLARELQEATSDLLDRPPKRLSASGKGEGTSIRDAREPAWSRDSKLVLLKDNVEGLQAPTVSNDQKVVIHQEAVTNGLLHQKTEQSDRLGSLSTRAPPIRPSSAFRPTETDASTQDVSPFSVTRSSSDLAKLRNFDESAAQKAGKSAKTRSIWLNEKGERILDGQIIGTMSLADKPEGSHTAVKVRGPEGHPQSSSDRLPEDVSTSEAPLRPTFDHVSHGAHARLHTPDFFQRSFPDVKASKAKDEEPPASSGVSAPSPGLLPQSANISRSVSPVLSIGRSSVADTAVAEVTTDPITLHGNRRAATRAGKEVPHLSGRSNQPLRLSSPPSRQGGGIAWETGREGSRQRLRSSMRSSSYLRDRPLLDRASSLFTTPLVPQKAERESENDDEAADAWEDHDVSSATDEDDASLAGLSAPLSPPLAGNEDDRSSLVSLPASSITATNSDGASFSRRASLRRGNSYGSAASASSRSSVRRRNSLSRGGEVFARDVRVRGWSEVGTRTRGYVSFEVVVLTTRGVVIRAHRRYSSFVALRRYLAQEVPPHKAALPSLPPKDALHKYSAKHLEQRRLALTTWLQAVVLDPRWGPRTRDWLIGPE